MITITDDFGKIRLNGQTIPGIYQNMSVKGAIKVDKPEIEGQSGSSKLPMGYKDAVITLTLKLDTDDQYSCYDKVEQLAGIFKNTDENAKPYIYNVVNKLTEAWGINEIIFDELETRDSNKDNSIIANIHFTEYKPVMISKEDRANLNTSDDVNEEDFANDQSQNNSNNSKADDLTSPAQDDDQP